MTSSPFIVGDVLATGAAFIWSIALLFFRVSSRLFSAATLNIYKTFVTIPCLLVTCLALKIEVIPQASFHIWGIIILSGIMGVGIGDSLYMACLKRVGPSLQAIVDISCPVIMLGLSSVFLHETISLKGVFGMVLVMVAIALGPERGALKVPRERRTLIIGIACGLCCHTIVSLSVIIVTDVLKNYPPIWVLMWRFVLGALTVLVFQYLRGVRREIHQVFRWKYAKFNLTGSLIGTYFGAILWMTSYKYTLAWRASLLNNTSVIFVQILAMVFLKEKLTFQRALAITIGLIGVTIVTTS